MTDLTSMPVLNVATAEFQIRLAGRFGSLKLRVLLKSKAGIAPSSSGGANSQIKKGELSPWLNCRYTVLNTPQNAARIP